MKTTKAKGAQSPKKVVDLVWEWHFQRKSPYKKCRRQKSSASNTRKRQNHVKHSVQTRYGDVMSLKKKVFQFLLSSFGGCAARFRACPPHPVATSGCQIVAHPCLSAEDYRHARQLSDPPVRGPPALLPAPLRFPKVAKSPVSRQATVGSWTVGLW